MTLMELQAVTCCCVELVHARHIFEGNADLDQTPWVDMIILVLKLRLNAHKRLNN